MATPIRIDLSETVLEFNLNPFESQLLGTAVVDRVVQEYFSKWNNLVNTQLRQSKVAYRSAMSVERPSGLEAVFVLSAKNSLAMMVEEGAPPFDEKPGFQKSNKVKPTKNGLGWYLTIPFRHATPQAIAESEVFSSILPQEIYDLAKNQTAPLKRNQLPPEHQVLGSRAAIKTLDLEVPEYIHKSPKYEGLVKVEVASSEKEKRNEYMTFRRVSNNSDPNSWWNGGIEAKKLMDKALGEAQIGTVVDMAIDETLEQILNNK